MKIPIIRQWNVKYGGLDTIKYMIEQGVDIHQNNGELLYWGIIRDDLVVVKYFHQLGANIHENNNELVKYLIDTGADISVFNKMTFAVNPRNEYLNIVCYFMDINVGLM
jgi:ankyrin repeat protein